MPVQQASGASWGAELHDASTQTLEVEVIPLYRSVEEGGLRGPVLDASAQRQHHAARLSNGVGSASRYYGGPTTSAGSPVPMRLSTSSVASVTSSLSREPMPLDDATVPKMVLFKPKINPPRVGSASRPKEEVFDELYHDAKVLQQKKLMHASAQSFREDKKMWDGVRDESRDPRFEHAPKMRDWNKSGKFTVPPRDTTSVTVSRSPWKQKEDRLVGTPRGSYTSQRSLLQDAKRDAQRREIQSQITTPRSAPRSSTPDGRKRGGGDCFGVQQARPPSPTWK
jgi:hypothetical protein